MRLRCCRIILPVFGHQREVLVRRCDYRGILSLFCLLFITFRRESRVPPAPWSSGWLRWLARRVAAKKVVLGHPQVFIFSFYSQWVMSSLKSVLLAKAIGAGWRGNELTSSKGGCNNNRNILSRSTILQA